MQGACREPLLGIDLVSVPDVLLGESIHSLTLLLVLCPPSPPLIIIIVLYCTLTGKSSTKERSQSGELAVIRAYSTV